MDGATIEGAPAIVHLRFNEPVSPLVVSLTDAKGQAPHRDLAVKARNECSRSPCRRASLGAAMS